MRLREHPAVASRGNSLQVDPRLLTVKPGFNIRDLDSPDERADLDELKEQIRGVGVQQPLVVRLDGDELVIVSGHRRHKVTMELIQEGEAIATVPAVPEQDGTDDAERALNLKRMNSGKPLTRLQDAEIVRRLVGYGWTHQKIAAGMGWKSHSSVAQALELLAMPTDVKTLVTEGQVSATVAASAIREHGPDFAKELIQANLEENRRIKGKPTRATPQGIRNAAAKARPNGKSKPETKPAESYPETAFDTTTDAANAGGPVAAEQPRKGIRGLIEALEPFHRFAELNDLNERSDDDVLEIPVRDIKRAARAYAIAAGEL